MTEKTIKYKIIPPRKVLKHDTSGRPAGMARTRKIINAQQAMESQFIMLCSQIRLDDNRQDRAENQREERRVKRKQIIKTYRARPARKTRTRHIIRQSYAL